MILQEIWFGCLYMLSDEASTSATTSATVSWATWLTKVPGAPTRLHNLILLWRGIELAVAEEL